MHEYGQPSAQHNASSKGGFLIDDDEEYEIETSNMSYTPSYMKKFSNWISSKY